MHYEYDGNDITLNKFNIYITLKLRVKEISLEYETLKEIFDSIVLKYFAFHALVLISTKCIHTHTYLQSSVINTRQVEIFTADYSINKDTFIARYTVRTQANLSRYWN